jgi:hypothetical protein
MIINHSNISFVSQRSCIASTDFSVVVLNTRITDDFLIVCSPTASPRTAFGEVGELSVSQRFLLVVHRAQDKGKWLPENTSTSCPQGT